MVNSEEIVERTFYISLLSTMLEMGLTLNPEDFLPLSQENEKRFQEAIKGMKKDVKSQADIARVAAISSADEEVGQMVADAMEKVSKDGVITIEESKTMKTELDLVEGMQFDRGYVSAYMATDMEKMEAVLDNPYILITDKKISNIQEILPLLENLMQQSGKLLIISTFKGKSVFGFF